MNFQMVVDHPNSTLATYACLCLTIPRQSAAHASLCPGRGAAGAVGHQSSVSSGGMAGGLTVVVPQVVVVVVHTCSIRVVSHVVSGHHDRGPRDRPAAATACPAAADWPGRLAEGQRPLTGHSEHLGRCAPQVCCPKPISTVVKSAHSALGTNRCRALRHASGVLRRCFCLLRTSSGSVGGPR
jgi:hypothetical protein